MPKTTITYRIFVASPSDVNEERSLVKSISEELNSMDIEKDIRLDVIGWENATYPSIGDDGQDVINKQINDDYDIFIGIIWSRFGTKTKRDSSGTKEEFERVFNRYLMDKNSVHILMYFKNAPFPTLDIDTEQLKLVQDFRKDIINRGALVSKFNQPDEFARMLRLNLSKLLHDIAADNKTSIEQITDTKSIVYLENSPTKQDELGYWEYMDIAVKGFNDTIIPLDKISQQIIALAVKLKKRTEAIYSLKNKPQDLIERESRKIIETSAGDLNVFTNKITPLVSEMNSLFINSFNNFDQAILIHKQFLNREGLQITLMTLKKLKGNLLSAFQGCDSMNQSIKNLPPMSRKLIKSKNEAMSTLTQLTDSFLSNTNIVDNIIKMIDD